MVVQFLGHVEVTDVGSGAVETGGADRLAFAPPKPIDELAWQGTVETSFEIGEFIVVGAACDLPIRVTRNYRQQLPDVALNAFAFHPCTLSNAPPMRSTGS